LPRLWVAIAIVAAVAALGVAPAAAQASVTSSQITKWTSSEAGTPLNAAYLISNDNNGTTLTVSGETNGGPGDHVDVVCFYGGTPGGAARQYAVLASDLPVQSNQSFSTPTGGSAPALKSIAGHACRLRAVPTGSENNLPTVDAPQFDGPQVAVSEVGLPSALFDGKPYDFYVVAATFSAYAAWDSAGSCGPYAAPFDPGYGQGNFALNCMGSLLGSANLLSLGGRSEVQVDGQNAYDAASAQSVFGGTEDSQTLPAVGAAVAQDPNNGSITSQSTEGWAVCPGAIVYPPTALTCPHFTGAGVQLERDITTSDGGLVVTMTDTWSSTDGRAHSLDLLYDDYVGLKSPNDVQRGYEFPGQSVFSPYQAGATLPGPGAAPATILLRTNLAAPDGDLQEAVGAITFSSPPTGFSFVSNSEFEEHQALEVPAGGSTTLTYVYSTGYTVAQAKALGLAAQDGVQPPAIAITSPADGSTVSTPIIDVTGTAGAGAGLASLSVSGQTVPVGPGGSWSAQIPLSPGTNTITAVGTDLAGERVEAQVTIAYVPPPPPPGPVCKVPRTKGMKLSAAERALRRAHCRVGRIRHQRSKKARKGRVFATSPHAGYVMRAGSKVELFVSKGR
jgi:Glucodextranase, domain B/PASTA domain